jgi:hypothetical protein
MLLVFLVMFYTSCEKSTNPTDNDKPPPGFQEDIPWPSLADSPWPMYHGDPQSSGRSILSGPMTGEIEWVIDSVYIKSGTSVGPDSTIYFINLVPPTPSGLIAVNPNGSIKWINEEVVTNPDVHTTPLITADNNIIIGGGQDRTIYALNSDGLVKWKYVADSHIYFGGLNIDLNGNIYFVARDQNLYVISKNGTLITKIYNPDFVWAEYAGTGFSPDGSTIYVPGYGPTVFAVDVKTYIIKWSFGEVRLWGSPVVNSQGHIYIHSKLEDLNEGKASLYCINADGTIRWSYPHNNPFFDEPISYLEGTIDKMGNYYFGFDSLYSVDFNGKLNWKISLNGYLEFPLVSDNNSNIYYKLDDRKGGYINRFVSTDMSGNSNWQINIDPGQFGGYSPAIGFNQELYIPTYKSTLFYRIK